MSSTSLDQAVTLLQQSRVPVIIIPERPSTDAVAAALALLLVLEHLGKNVRVVCPDFTLPPGHDFLPKSDAITPSLSNLRNFIISLDISKVKLESLSYAVDGDKLNIFLTPKNGYFEPQHVSTSAGQFAYDAIITLDIQSLDQLGSLYADNAEFFYHTPIVNIDHRSTNTRFGHANVVDVVASSISEIIFELVKQLGYQTLNEHVATSLLAGIISKTKVFQSHTVTPRSLAIASHLISAGGRRDAIIQHLYQTKTLSTLKLWGRALAKIKASSDQLTVWSVITRRDIDETGASIDEAPGVVDELMVNTPKAKHVALFIDHPNGTLVHVAVQSGAAEPALPEELVLRSPLYWSGVLPVPIDQAERSVIEKLSPPKKPAA